MQISAHGSFDLMHIRCMPSFNVGVHMKSYWYTFGESFTRNALWPFPHWHNITSKGSIITTEALPISAFIFPTRTVCVICPIRDYGTSEPRREAYGLRASRGAKGGSSSIVGSKSPAREKAELWKDP